MNDWKNIRIALGVTVICGLVTLFGSGCSTIRPETAGLMAYELGFATGAELASASGDAVSGVSDSLEAALIQSVESEFRQGFSDGLDSVQ